MYPTVIAPGIELFDLITRNQPMSANNPIGYKMTNRDLCDYYIRSDRSVADSNQAPESFSRAMSGSDLPALVDDLMTKSLNSAYSSPSAWEQITTAINLPNFLPSSVVTASACSGFLLKKEGGEYRSGKIAASSENAQIETFARMMSVTRELFMAEDLGLFERLGQAIADKAKSLENDLFFELLAANPSMSDGIPFFNVGHGNVGTPAPASAATISELLRLIGEQPDDEGNAMNLRGVTLIAGLSQMMSIEAIFAGTETGIKRVYDARITNGAHYMATERPGINVLHLASAPRPVAEFRPDWSSDVLEFKCRHDVGCAMSDYKTMAFNAGA